MGERYSSLGLILVVSLVLRVWLAHGGGQNYWPDEVMRYGDSRTAAYHVLEGEWDKVVAELFRHPDHTLFRWIALPPAVIDQWLGFDAFRSACYFSVFSVALIGLIWAIARRSGANRFEAFAAAGLAACSTSLFFYSRHFFPYDASLAILCSGLWFGLGNRNLLSVFGAGAAAGLGFLVYNGYWLFAAVVMAVASLSGSPAWRDRVIRAAVAIGGWALVVGSVVMTARGLGFDLLSGARENAGTIIQGDFGYGWKVILEYLWTSDGPLAVLWAVLVVAAVRLSYHSGDRVLRMWLFVGVALVFGLIVLSDIWSGFVVYGRLVRQMVPVICLIGGRVIYVGLIDSRRRRGVQTAVAAVAIVSAVLGFRVPLMQEFPVDFISKARASAIESQKKGGAIFQILNANNLWGVDVARVLPEHQVVLRASHPLQFRPYQFEGMSVNRRAELRANDISMRLVRLTSPNLRLPISGHPDLGANLGPIRLRLKFDTGMFGRAEPLVTTGIAGAGDFLYVRYVDERRIRFGFDHWNGGAVESEPVEIDYSKEHDVVLSMGSLVPEEGADLYENLAWTKRLQKLVFVAIDGKAVFSAWSDTHRCDPGEVFIGTNFIGGSSAAQEFTGTLRRVERVPLGDFEELLPFGRVYRLVRPPEWDGAKGPWKMQLRLGATAVGTRELLFASSTIEGVETLEIETLDEQMARLLYEYRGRRAVSSPFPARIGGSFELDFSSSLSFPRSDAPLLQQQPELNEIVGRVVAVWNGTTVLNLQGDPGSVRAVDFFLVDRPPGYSGGAGGFSGAIENMELLAPETILAGVRQAGAMIEARGGQWSGFPGPVRILVRMPEIMPSHNTGEPLLVSGITGAGNFVTLSYENGNRIRIGYDHWGTGSPPISEPLEYVPGQVIPIVVSSGFLMPPKDSTLYQLEPGLVRLLNRIVVEVEGRTVLDAVVPAHQTKPEQILVGLNTIGGSTARPSFSGVIEGVERVSAEDLLARPTSQDQ